MNTKRVLLVLFACLLGLFALGVVSVPMANAAARKPDASYEVSGLNKQSITDPDVKIVFKGRLDLFRKNTYNFDGATGTFVSAGSATASGKVRVVGGKNGASTVAYITNVPGIGPISFILKSGSLPSGSDEDGDFWQATGKGSTAEGLINIISATTNTDFKMAFSSTFHEGLLANDPNVGVISPPTTGGANLVVSLNVMVQFIDHGTLTIPGKGPKGGDLLLPVYGNIDQTTGLLTLFFVYGKYTFTATGSYIDPMSVRGLNSATNPPSYGLWSATPVL